MRSVFHGEDVHGLRNRADGKAPPSVPATKIHTTLQRIGGDIGTGFGSLMQALVREKISPSGPPLIVYHDVIDTAIDGDSSVYGRELEGGTMAVTIHHGPYVEIALAYQTLTEWIAARGHEIEGPPRETYLNDPQTVPAAELLHPDRVSTLYRSRLTAPSL